MIALSLGNFDPNSPFIQPSVSVQPQPIEPPVVLQQSVVSHQVSLTLCAATDPEFNIVQQIYPTPYQAQPHYHNVHQQRSPRPGIFSQLCTCFRG
jgi:hypothetical protein